MFFIGQIVATGANPASNLQGTPFALPYGGQIRLVSDASGTVFSLGFSGALGASGALNMAPIAGPGVTSDPFAVGPARTITVVGPATVRVFAVPR